MNMTANQRPEDIARDNIDRQLKQAGGVGTEAQRL